MKKFLLILSLLFLLTGCEMNLKDDYIVDITSSKSCNNEIEEYYTTDSKKIYTVCIDKITLKDNNHKIALNKYLNQKDVNLDNTMKDIIDKVVGETSIVDGSATIYLDGGTTKYTKNGYTIITCNTNDGNNDIYIATDKLQMKDNSISGFCGNE